MLTIDPEFPRLPAAPNPPSHSANRDYSDETSEDSLVFALDASATSVEWACDDPKIRAELLDTAANGYAGVLGSRAVEIRLSEWLQHATAVVEEAQGLDPSAKRFVSTLLTSIAGDGTVVQPIGDLAVQAAAEREQERRHVPLPA